MEQKQTDRIYREKGESETERVRNVYPVEDIKSGPFLRYVHRIHCLFISCYTETERVGNEKFRQEARPFLLLEIAR